MVTPPPDDARVIADDRSHRARVVPFPSPQDRPTPVIEVHEPSVAVEAVVERAPAPSAPPSQALVRWTPTQIAPRGQVAVEEVPRSPHKFPPLGDCRLGRIVTEHLVVDDALDPRLTPLSDPRGAAAEAYRALFFRLGATADACSIMVTPASEQEDASICAASLALVMAMASGGEVLLIEATFSNPRLANLFAYRPSECFGRRLARHRSAPDAPWRIAKLGDSPLHLLSVDPAAAVPPAMDARALAEVVESFRRGGFRHVVVSAPALTKGSDACFVAKCVDGALVAMHAGTTRERDLKRTLAQLAPTPCLGTVLIEGEG